MFVERPVLLVLSEALLLRARARTSAPTRRRYPVAENVSANGEGRLGISLLIGGLAMIGMGLFRLGSEALARHRAVEVAGEVVGFAEDASDSEKSSFGRPVARYAA